MKTILSLKIICLLSFSFVTACSGGTQNTDIDPTSDSHVQPTGAKAPEGYAFKLAFSDEFNGTDIDESKWYYRTGSKNVSTMLAENNRVSDGKYIIDLKKEKVGEMDYTCGGIISRKFVRYGYYESSLKIPNTGGWHASFWMMNDTPFPRLELDPFENDSVFQSKYTVDAHYWRTPKDQDRLGTDPVRTEDLSDRFHVIGMLFTPTELKYYHDGKLVHTYDATELTHLDVNIWLSCLGFVNGYNTHEIDDSNLPTIAEFEYVRLFDLVER